MLGTPLHRLASCLVSFDCHFTFWSHFRSWSETYFACGTAYDARRFISSYMSMAFYLIRSLVHILDRSHITRTPNNRIKL
jgi:hypothetical protein